MRRPLAFDMERTHLLNSFQDFGLAEPIARALAEEKYVTPTPIQAQTIPTALTGRDVVGIAQTGTGKTASFALPILHRLLENRIKPQPKTCRVLVLSPTRELSGQILDSFNAYGRHIRLSSTLAIGGVPMGRQVRSLMQGVDVLVATPGRLLDLVQSNGLKLGSVEFLVLDEADRMLDMGFINDIRKIVAKLPIKRQTLFFSATMPKDIAELADAMLRDPVRVAVTPVSSTAERINQRIIQVDFSAKPAFLTKLLKDEPINRALVFTRTKHGADKVVKTLEKAGVPASAIHGNKSQNHRERTLAQFRSGQIRTLVATDIAARGIDVDGITHVINFDLPNVPETYVHRIGRTARAGAEGTAISLVAGGEELAYLRDIERLIKVTLAREDHRTDAGRRDAGAPPPQQRQGRPGGRPGQRPQGARHGEGRHGDGRRTDERHADGRRPSAVKQGDGRPGEGRHGDARHAEGRPGSGPSNSKGSRRRPSGGKIHSAPSDRSEQRSAHSAGASDGIQGVAFLRRESRPNSQPNRKPHSH
ncbi:DEAD/DEAH box helicase [Bradyrhizobium diazoefficiens]|jgi:ATP-dependent RNA helicase RhlE|nr:DEAD/DEAH box helicase [Bradyrhizobium diazoefficiens]MBR0967413.1 DEAD/DEAH box helicase [Bradyrhizobium diazoefficiens]MBR0980738.1 DEAD/DEAH box helicase [Bradyrhizobium diazoefficiens]MBR1010284.1 DEAD/DEAH box helicase [Bradyrhizobium diazoefficiens]MBR1016871.1 DEAD/DEAH box helicase [Bradyrhizobium diazoefficiens]MBR1054030.1 DEAD/DEAH box helicase [Bradyrhizobium diazoefficiens]